MKKTLYPPQQAAVDHLAKLFERKRAVLNASFPGTGKTLMSVELTRRLGKQPLVVCPKTVIASWDATFEDQGVECYGITNYEQLRTGNTPYGTWLDKKSGVFEFDPEIEMVIWDEMHACMSRTSLNSSMMESAKPLINLLLSATAFENPSEMKASGYLLGLHGLSNYLIWATQYGCGFDAFGKLKFTRREDIAAIYLEEIRSQLYPACGVRLTREDMKEFFTRTSISTDPVDFGDDGKIQELYDEVEDAMRELEEKEANDDVHPAAEALVRTLRARQKVEMLKLPIFRDVVKEAVSEGYHVPVFLNFNDSIVELNRLLGGDCPVVWGTDPEDFRPQTADERAGNIDAFQRNEEKIILLNVAAGGVAINLHDERGGAPRKAFVSPSWNAKVMRQVLGRIDRAGAKTDTYQKVMFAAGTIEESVREALERKLSHLDQLHG